MTKYHNLLYGVQHEPQPLAPPMNIITFFQLQLDRLQTKTQVHTPGPKKPTLSQLDLKASKQTNA